VSDDMKEEQSPSNMGMERTIYEGGWDYDVHRIRLSQEVDASSCHRRSGKNHSGNASPKRQYWGSYLGSCLDIVSAEKPLGMLRRAQHERTILNVFYPFRVRPENLEG